MKFLTFLALVLMVVALSSPTFADKPGRDGQVPTQSQWCGYCKYITTYIGETVVKDTLVSGVIDTLTFQITPTATAFGFHFMPYKLRSGASTFDSIQILWRTLPDISVAGSVGIIDSAAGTGFRKASIIQGQATTNLMTAYTNGAIYVVGRDVDSALVTGPEAISLVGCEYLQILLCDSGGVGNLDTAGYYFWFDQHQSR